ncbi:MAG: prohibitin family protein, partial [Verrucomicrobiales bacterium]
EQVLIRRVNLPNEVRTAIADKNVALHNAEQYDYLIEKERKETVRKIIEAIGIKAFQDIVSAGITDSYLRWKGIDATLSLAESNNAKMV